MSKELNFNKKDLIKNVTLLIENEIPLIANLANITRLIYETIQNVSWCGFYLANEEGNRLYLGPFQGPIACTTILFGKGVCGTAAIQQKSQLVPNVHEFPGHIACSSLTNSELVVPVIKNNQTVGVLDLDSNELNNFNMEDQLLLEELCNLLANLF